MFGVLNFFSSIFDFHFFHKSDEFLLHAALNNQHRAAFRPADLFVFEKKLLQLGNLAKVILPSITLSVQPSLVNDYTSMSKRVPVAKSAKKMAKISLCEDENAAPLAIKYECDVVMTNSAFVYLVYHLSQTKQLNLDELKMPLSVKHVECGGKNSQSVFKFHIKISTWKIKVTLKKVYFF